jgi:hypothetical protein
MVLTDCAAHAQSVAVGSSYLYGQKGLQHPIPMWSLILELPGSQIQSFIIDHTEQQRLSGLIFWVVTSVALYARTDYRLEHDSPA